MNQQNEEILIDQLSKAETPTEIVRRAFAAKACEIKLTYEDRTIVVRDDKFRATRR